MFLVIHWVLQSRNAQVASLAHVVDWIALFLLDGYALPLDQVVRRNSLGVLQFLLTNATFGKHFSDESIGHGLRAAAAQHHGLGAMKTLWNYETTLDQQRLQDLQLFELAVVHGNLDMIQWLWQHHRQLCDLNSLTTASRLLVNDLNVVKFLHQNNLLKRPQQVANRAAAEGNISVVEYLARHAMVSCAKCVLAKAALFGQIEMVLWLESHPWEHATTCDQIHWFASTTLPFDAFLEVKPTAAEYTPPPPQQQHGSRSLQWVVQRFPQVPFDHNYLFWFAQAGELTLVTKIYARIKYCCSEWVFGSCLEAASRAGHVNVVQFFLAHGHRLHSLKKVFGCGPNVVVKYLNTRYSTNKSDGKVQRRIISVNATTCVSDIIEESMRCSHTEIVKLLCATHNDDWEQRNLLHLAAKLGMEELLEFFGIQDQPSAVKLSCMMIAIQEGPLEVVKWLFQMDDMQEQVTRAHQLFQKAIESALMYGKLDAVDYCLSRMPIPGDSNWFCGILHAVSRKQLAVLKILHQKQVDGFNAITLDSAALNGSLGIVRFLDKHRQEGCSTHAMDAAAGGGFLHVVKYLHTHRTEGCTTKAMDTAAENGHLRVVKYLHENRDEGCTSEAIHQATRNGHLAVSKYLLKNRPEVDAQRALMGACEGGHLEIIQWLLANYDKVDYQAAMRAVKQDHRFCRDWNENSRIAVQKRTAM